MTVRRPARCVQLESLLPIQRLHSKPPLLRSARPTQGAEMTDDLDRAIKHFYQDAGRLVRDARLRTKPRITQAQLADAVRMTRSSIANLEAGRQRIPLHVLVWIAEVLAVEPATLLPDRP